ncbi:N-acetyl-anhydromuranmyl-L-alanine amidase [Moraxella macacae 0408225]|uniref:1,6-anhydro-N-acetylmuramyl-L-alanine amidase AmpD n=1 Tax=Moraxella macacae 0408225 TaxID=1230338 RepID=L2F7X6_9GAMM|nr:1,6-anhydro-N-acetylmuramyl-L-alanine amidase AmpD [Moraxella macacae]ELA09015.1 N-acetyl-anhydromuranmyl-L-alanine amidase [Moraxella macacae 0408225]
MKKNIKIIDGKLNNATFIASPNFNKRPENSEISLIVIHNISLPPSEFGKTDQHGQHFVKAFFQNQLNPNDHPYFQSIYQQQVSAHLLIERTGKITQFVNFNDRAWHAGKSGYLGRENCNDFSIGIELEGDDYSEFDERQYLQLAWVIFAIYEAYPKTRRQLAGHSDVARGRKSDPGAYFDWQKLRNLLDNICQTN